MQYDRAYGMEYGLVRFAKLLRPCPNNLLNIEDSTQHRTRQGEGTI